MNRDRLLVDSTVATKLAGLIERYQPGISHEVSGRLLEAFPEIILVLRLEGDIHPIDQLADVAVRRFAELLRAVLLFELPSLIEQEFRWAFGVLPRQGVKYEHQVSMMRWFFDLLRSRPLAREEIELSHQLEEYTYLQLRQIYFSLN